MFNVVVRFIIQSFHRIIVKKNEMKSDHHHDDDGASILGTRKHPLSTSECNKESEREAMCVCVWVCLA